MGTLPARPDVNRYPADSPAGAAYRDEANEPDEMLAVTVLREAAERVCRKRLKLLIPMLFDAMNSTLRTHETQPGPVTTTGVPLDGIHIADHNRA